MCLGLLLTMLPFMERWFSFDHFLRGGQDFELSLVAFLAALCLVFILARALERGCHALLRALAALVIEDAPSRPSGLGLLAAAAAPPPGLPVALRRLPLRI